MDTKKVLIEVKCGGSVLSVEVNNNITITELNELLQNATNGKDYEIIKIKQD